MASEFHYFADNLESSSTIIAISQSGETADVLHAVREKAKENGSKILFNCKCCYFITCKNKRLRISI